MKKLFFKLLVLVVVVISLTGCSFAVGTGTYPITFENGETIQFSYASKECNFDTDNLTFNNGGKSVTMMGYYMDIFESDIVPFVNDLDFTKVSGDINGIKYTCTDDGTNYAVFYAVDGMDLMVAFFSTDKSFLDTVVSGIKIKPKKDNGSKKEAIQIEMINQNIKEEPDIEVQSDAELPDTIQDDYVDESVQDDYIDTTNYNGFTVGDKYEDWTVNYVCEYFVTFSGLDSSSFEVYFDEHEFDREIKESNYAGYDLNYKDSFNGYDIYAYNMSGWDNDEYIIVGSDRACHTSFFTDIDLDWLIQFIDSLNL